MQRSRATPRRVPQPRHDPVTTPSPLHHAHRPRHTSSTRRARTPNRENPLPRPPRRTSRTRRAVTPSREHTTQPSPSRMSRPRRTPPPRRARTTLRAHPLLSPPRRTFRPPSRCHPVACAHPVAVTPSRVPTPSHASTSPHAPPRPPSPRRVSLTPSFLSHKSLAASPSGAHHPARRSKVAMSRGAWRAARHKRRV